MTKAQNPTADQPITTTDLGPIENKDLATTVGDVQEATNRAGNVELEALHHLDLPQSDGEVKAIVPGDTFKVPQDQAAALIASFRAKLAG